MEGISTRIRELLESKYGNITQAARSLNICLNTLRSLVGMDKRLSQPQDPRLSTILAIIKDTGCDTNWLLFGIGDVYHNPDESLAYMRDYTRVNYNNSTRSAEDANRVQSLEEQIINLQNQVSTLVATNSILTAALAEARK